MKMLILMAAIIFAIALILIILVNFISKKTFQDRAKSSPFECGFDPTSTSRMPFSLQFFLIAIIFLIFDVEITLLLPLTQAFYTSNFFNYNLLMTLFMLILLLGLYHEWHQGALNWST